MVPPKPPYPRPTAEVCLSMSPLRVTLSPGSTPGLPGLVLPTALTRGGLPVALEFDGAAGSDRALLALGASLELALGPLYPPKEV